MASFLFLMRRMEGPIKRSENYDINGKLVCKAIKATNAFLHSEGREILKRPSDFVDKLKNEIPCCFFFNKKNG